MLGGEERDDVIARDVAPQVRHEMAEVILLLRTHRAVGEKDAHVAARQAANGMVHVDPCVHAFV